MESKSLNLYETETNMENEKYMPFPFCMFCMNCFLNQRNYQYMRNTNCMGEKCYEDMIFESRVVVTVPFEIYGIPASIRVNATSNILDFKLYIAGMGIAKEEFKKIGNSYEWKRKIGPALIKVVVFDDRPNNRIQGLAEARVGGRVVGKTGVMTLATWSDDLIQPPPSRIINAD